MIDAIIVSFITGVCGTGVGGLLAFFVGKRGTIQSILFSLTAGIMLAIVCFELIPEAIFTVDVFSVCIAVIMGTLAINLFENLFSSKNR